MKFSAFNLVSTVFLLWLTIQIESAYEEYLAYFFILTVGIVHGANDVSLISFITKSRGMSKNKYLISYIAIIIVMSIAFFQFPFLALLIFILFSCYHFGEQHFYSRLYQAGVTGNLLYLSYGILIFGLLFYLNYTETSSIIAELSGITLDAFYFLYFLILGLIATCVLVFINLKNFKDGVDYFQEFFLIALFALLFKMASLLWAFAIYFIIWHSLPSLSDQTKALYGRLDASSLIKYFKSSLVNWIISVIGLAVIFYISSRLEIRFITLFFAFLAAITIPHVIVMYYLNKK
jgi:Brp/Blh family beta-carotene 15,15'-monooxygenase